MKRLNIALMICALAVLAFNTQSVQAQIPKIEISDAPLVLANDQILLLAQKKKGLSPSQAARRAREKHGGKVVGTPKCRDTDSGTVCTVRLDINGKIKTVTIRG